MILAAGMGSRYGGLKQLDQLGPSGETIMDYSVYDAIRAGFGKIVFVIRRDFEDEFREKVISKYKNHISIEVVFQSLEALPQGFTKPEGRTKPWGTNHAIMMGAKVINEPFAVIYKKWLVRKMIIVWSDIVWEIHFLKVVTCRAAFVV